MFGERAMCAKSLGKTNIFTRPDKSNANRNNANSLGKTYGFWRRCSFGEREISTKSLGKTNIFTLLDETNAFRNHVNSLGKRTVFGGGAFSRSAR